MNDTTFTGGVARDARTDDTNVRRAMRSGDDKALLKAAAQLTRGLNTPNPTIFWLDMLGSALLGYAALAFAMFGEGLGLRIGAGLVAVLALYRAGSFIHEISHIKKGDLPYFRLVWNMLVGVPLFAPSFMYEGVHNQHHAKTKYGTKDDPEYLPLASMKPWSLPLFMVGGILAPFLLFGRFAILAPISFVSKRVRDEVVGRYSGLQINPDFRRERPEGEAARQFTYQEVGAFAWTWILIAALVGGVLPLGAFGVFVLVACGVMGLNQLRTLVAHFWENDTQEPMSVTAQYLDSVNVPPPGLLPALWAPVGLRYHALHHLLPGVPYHNLGEAHRRLVAELEEGSLYHRTSRRGLWTLVRHLVSATTGKKA